jgi:twitching motility protein PilI
VTELHSSGETSADADTGERLLRLIHDIEDRCLKHAVGLPQQRVVEETWEGVVFSVGGRLLVAPLGEVKEILNYPSVITSVPGTKSWVRGVANIRGNLLPVIDLQAFLLGRATVPGRRSRVLVVEHGGLFTSLLVDQMVGIRHFRLSEWSEEKVDLPEAVERFVEYSYRIDDEAWPVFSMHSLIENPEFQFAAA